VSGPSRPPLPQALADYLDLRRSLGFELHDAGRLLGQFVDYLDERGVDTVTNDHALTWATLPAGTSATWHAIRLSAVRGFAAYLRGIDPPWTCPRPA
jgi:integrase/recombinase XerD